MRKLDISAIVVSHNEGNLLNRCLQRLSFCSEILVINLSSTDNTVEVAKNFGATVLNYPKYPIVEQALYRAIPEVTSEWILITDPDEEMGTSLKEEIFRIFNNSAESYDAIRVPIQYYFKSHPLKGTIWGGSHKHCRYLFRKDSIILSDNVHQGYQLKEDGRVLVIERTDYDKVNHHYWMTSYKSLFEKHRRYLDYEGKRMHENYRYSVISQIKATIIAFKNCYLTEKGYKDGVTGFFLSIFWSYYTFMSWNSLLQFSKTHPQSLK